MFSVLIWPTGPWIFLFIVGFLLLAKWGKKIKGYIYNPIEIDKQYWSAYTDTENRPNF